VCLLLTVLVFAQSAGRTASDTKLDLVVDPLRFLRRALTLWDPVGAAGQLQNQAYGYLFPMGPFFALGKLVALPPWMVQRGWESALVLAAFLGTVRLVRLLGIEAFWPKVTAGLVYALAPRMLSELGSISSELMPVAVLPWLLIPLVIGSRRGSPRRYGTLAGVAFLFAGGVNAAASLAILPVPVLWLLTRQPGARRRALTAWFALGIVLSSAWWAIPLVLLGRYSPPFLDWIEPSQVTTGVTSLVDSLRGTDHWQAYLGAGVWPGGWILVSVPAVIVATAAVGAAGLAGLARADLADRLCWRGCLLIGMVLVGLGYVATVGPPAGSLMRGLLDGPLAAFRNVHKFDPLIRLPIAIGAGQLAYRLRVPATVRLRSVRLHARPLALLLAIVVGVLALSPAITNNLVPQGRPVTEATWWRQTGGWLGQHEGAGRALLVPGANRPVYSWGSTVDDALQPVATGPWTVRDGIPLAPAGYIRLLDSVSLRLAAGHRDDVLPRLLAGAGIRYLVVRNDLDTVASGSTPLVFVHAAIEATPGLSPVASFGPADRLPAPAGQLVDLGATEPRPMVQIYQVAGWAGPVQLLPAGSALPATGSADALGTLLDAGLDPQTPVLFDAGNAARVVTDGIARREVNFGQTGVAPATMTARQPYRLKRKVHDYLPPGAGPALSTVSYGGGLSDVTASSSGAEAGALVNPGAASQPWSALDGDPSTAWKSSALTGAVGQWLRLRLTNPLSPSRIQVAFSPQLGGYPDRVRVQTDAGSQDLDVTPDSTPQQLAVPAGPTQSITLTVLDATAGTTSVGIATLAVPGLTPTRTVQVPTGRAAPDLIAFSDTAGMRSECLTIDGRAACDPSFTNHGESDGVIDRTFSLPGDADYRLAAQVVANPGPALDQLLDAGRRIEATASSVDSPEPRERAGAAVDGDPRTSWVAASGDLQPSLTLRLASSVELTSLGLSVDARAPVARPSRIAVTAGGHRWIFAMPADGLLQLPQPVRTTTIRLTVLTAQLRLNTSTLTGGQRLLPVGISEISINGHEQPAAADVVRFDCGSGLALQAGDRSIAMRATARRAVVLSGRPFRASPCSPDPLALSRGSQHLRLAASGPLSPTTLVLSRVGTATAASIAGTATAASIAGTATAASIAGTAAADPIAGTATVGSWQATRRTVVVHTVAAALLVVHENVNAGWRASLDGHRLQPVTVDGWQQGWALPAGASGTVSLSYQPQHSFVLGLVLGALAVLAVFLLAFVRTGADARAAAPERVAPDWTYLALAFVGSSVLAGPVGLLVAAGIAAACRWLPSRLPYWSAGVPLLLAGLAEAARPAGKPDPLAGAGWVQALCVSALCLLLLSPTGFRQAGVENRRSRGRSKQSQDTVASTVEEAAVSRKSFQKWP